MAQKIACLNMIVKNEAHCIERCLKSVLPLIDWWIIVDTGSTDGTQEIIKKFFATHFMPGKLYERLFVDFATNRNEAIRLAKYSGDYLLFIDADDYVDVSQEFEMPDLDLDMYEIVQREGNGQTYREHEIPFIIKNDGRLEYKGEIHEYLSRVIPNDIITRMTLDGIKNVYTSEGSRGKDPDKVLKDIELLKKDLTKSRNNLYLARAYYSLQDYDNALLYFQNRSHMGEDPIEVYYSLLYVAICMRELHFDPIDYINALFVAHAFRPSRAEAIYELLRFFVDAGNFYLAYLVGKEAITLPKSTDNLFVEHWVTEWGIVLYHFLACHHSGHETEATLALRRTLQTAPQKIIESFNLKSFKELYGIK